MRNNNNPDKIFPETYQPLKMSTEKPCKIKCDIGTSISRPTLQSQRTTNSTSWTNAFGFYKQWRMNAPKKWKTSLEKTKKSLANCSTISREDVHLP